MTKINLNVLRMKEAFKMKYKVFFITFKGLLLKQKKKFFLQGEILTLNGHRLLVLNTKKQPPGVVLPNQLSYKKLFFENFDSQFRYSPITLLKYVALSQFFLKDYDRK